MTRRRHAATLALFALFAVIHTWPLAAAPHRLSRIDNGDYSLNAWALAWVVHQAPRDPLHLFDANIFYPEPRTLALSEHMFPQAVMAAPVIWAGGSAVLAYNLTLLLGFALTGWAMAAVLTRWTSDWAAGLVAGSILAFNTHTLTRLPQLQALHNEFLPLALFALDRAMRSGSWRASMRTAVFSALQGLTSGYLLVFTACGMTAAALVRIRDWWPRRVPQLAAAAVVGALLVGPFLVPYWQNWREDRLARSLPHVAAYAASWVDYVTSAGRLHMMSPLKWAYFAERDNREKLFPGVTATALTLLALTTGLAWRDRRARMWLALGVIGIVLSLGTRTPLYGWLYTYFPLVQGIRMISRFGWLALAAAAALSGFALAAIRRRLVPGWKPRHIAALTAGVIALVHAEALHAPFEYVPFDGVPRVYELVARLPHAVLAEFPFYGMEMFQGQMFQGNAIYMLNSTVHWKPLLNGYSGFAPASYRRNAKVFQSFPSQRSVERLRRAGVTHVMLHRDLYGADAEEVTRALEQTGAFRTVAGDEHLRLYRLLPR